tara:strand:+ start:376 stop:864 length:489 start_codon:yes stop_codon:yes gene_type:complete
MNREHHYCVMTALASLALVTSAMTISIIPSSPVFAAGGDVILTRQVQTRVATRPPLVPDPNPLVVNTKPSTYVGDDLQMRNVPGELDDQDFAAVTSGARMIQQTLAPLVQGNPAGAASGVNHSAIAGSNPVGHAGNALGNIDGQINRSIEQGLRPLQMLQRP